MENLLLFRTQSKMSLRRLFPFFCNCACYYAAEKVLPNAAQSIDEGGTTNES